MQSEQRWKSEYTIRQCNRGYGGSKRDYTGEEIKNEKYQERIKLPRSNIHLIIVICTKQIRWADDSEAIVKGDPRGIDRKVGDALEYRKDKKDEKYGLCTFLFEK